MDAQTQKLIEDLKMVRPDPVSTVPWWILAAVCVAILAGLWVAFRRQRPAKIVPARPPHEVALEELEAARPLLSEENALVFVKAISQAVRTYIEGRYGLRAPKLTTTEFLGEASHSKLLSAPEQELVGAFLEICDLTKFADAKATFVELVEMHQSAFEFVRQTIPVVAKPQ